MALIICKFHWNRICVHCGKSEEEKRRENQIGDLNINQTMIFGITIIIIIYDWCWSHAAKRNQQWVRFVWEPASEGKKMGKQIPNNDFVSLDTRVQMIHITVGCSFIVRSLLVCVCAVFFMFESQSLSLVHSQNHSLMHSFQRVHNMVISTRYKLLVFDSH